MWYCVVFLGRLGTTCFGSPLETGCESHIYDLPLEKWNDRTGGTFAGSGGNRLDLFAVKVRQGGQTYSASFSFLNLGYTLCIYIYISPYIYTVYIIFCIHGLSFTICPGPGSCTMIAGCCWDEQLLSFGGKVCDRQLWWDSCWGWHLWFQRRLDWGFLELTSSFWHDQSFNKTCIWMHLEYVQELQDLESETFWSHTKKEKKEGWLCHCSYLVPSHWSLAFLE